MKHQWLAYVIVAILSIGAGVAIAGLPDSVPESETIVPPSTIAAPEPTVPPTTTTGPAATTTTEPEVTETTEPEETETTEPEATETSEPDETTTTVSLLADRADVNVAVANGAGKAGIAAATAGELVGLGYQNIAALTGDDVVDVSTVYFADGNVGIAERMAADLGLPPGSVVALGFAPNVQQLGLVQLLVYIGRDRA
jgi:predicted flap endonuclease-1-like 5' DNA nuclease